MRPHARFSRWMPPEPERPTTLRAAAAIGVIGAVVLGPVLLSLVVHPVPTLFGIAFFAAVFAYGARKFRRWATRPIEGRPGEDIGTFARAFDRRAASPPDPWAIRAVWDSFGRVIPLRPSDRFEDVWIDPDDVHDEVYRLVERCERVPGNWQANPWYGTVDTVGDLVHFISAQPLRDG